MTKQEIKDLFEKLFAEIPDDETTETETTETTSTDVETVENPVETLETETITTERTKSGDEVTTTTLTERTIKVDEKGDYIYV